MLHRSFVIASVKYLYDLLHKIEAENRYGNPALYNDEASTFSQEYFIEIEAERTEIYQKSGNMLPKRLPRVIAWIDEIKEVCERNGIQLIVMLIPDEVQLDSELRNRVLDKLNIDKKEMDFDLPNKLLGDELRSRHIRYLDLLEPFRLQSQFTRLYKPRDTHWNIAGNQLAAEVLYKFLQESLDKS